MKYICFNRTRDIEFGDAEYFINANSKKDFNWVIFTYRIEDEHAEFLKIKYPDIVLISEDDNIYR